MLSLAVRLAAGGGREQWVRLAVTAAGVALGTALLLLAAVAYPAMHAHEVRDAWTYTGTRNVQPAQDEARTDPLLWRLRWDSYAGQDIARVDVAPLGPRAPLPPGLSRLPGPGELAASPALARLLRGVPAGVLGDRFPGRITATVGNAALRYPGSLVVFAGYSPAALRGQPGVDEIRSIETRPVSVSLSRFGRVVVAIGAVALLMPLLVLIATATRLAAARREQRLAAMRLVGATQGQLLAVTVTEALLGALAGTLLGFLLFFVARPYAARVDVDGSPFFPADLALSWWSGALIGVGVPVLSGAAALLSLRRVRISPLGVSRRSVPVRPGWRRLIPLGASLVLFAASLPVLMAQRSDSALWMIAGGVALLVAGIVVAGPWLTRWVGRLVIALSRGTPGLLAGRRLADDPAAGFRAISGLVLAVFLVTVTSTATAIAVRPRSGGGTLRAPASTLITPFLLDGSLTVSIARAGALAAALRAIPGVTGVVELHRTSTAPLPEYPSSLPAVAPCADVRAAGLAACTDPSALVELDALPLGRGLEPSTGPAHATAPLAGLPVLGLFVTTDGRTSTVERARTTIEVAVPTAHTPPWTVAELKGIGHRQQDEAVRISDAVLLASLLIAGFSLAVSVAGGLLERKRAFALLRLAGMRPAELRRVLLAETAGPLVTVALVSAGLGIAVVSYAARVGRQPWAPPYPSYWWVLGAGLVLAVGVAVGATAPLLGRLTSLETARFE